MLATTRSAGLSLAGDAAASVAIGAITAGLAGAAMTGIGALGAAGGAIEANVGAAGFAALATFGVGLGAFAGTGSGAAADTVGGGAEIGLIGVEDADDGGGVAGLGGTSWAATSSFVPEAGKSR